MIFNNRRFDFTSLLVMFVAVVLFVGAASAQTTVFTYQGKLTDNGTPQTSYQMEFKLFGSPGGTDQIGETITNTNVTVNQGVFTVQLNFASATLPGAAAFPGADRFLQISVRRSASESFVTLNPRQQITSSPYSIRTLSAAQADVALDSQKLGGVNASEYVTTTSVGNSFIKNSTAQQTDAKFNIDGNGTLGGTLQANAVTAQTATGSYGLRHTDGTTTIGTYVGGSGSGAAGGWLGTLTNQPLHFFTNGGQPRMTIDPAGNVGIGTFTPQAGVRLDVSGNSVFRTANGNINLGTPNSETGVTITGTNRADFRFNGSTLKLVAGLGVGAPADTNGISINTAGNVGIGTTTPNTRLTLNGGTPWTSAGWTASMNLQNVSALGWEANAFGQRFGIGQTNGGLYFFRTRSAFGNTDNPASYDLQITDNGDLKQPRNKGGLAKAMIYVDPSLPAPNNIVRCYNGITESSDGRCGFSVIRNGTGFYRIDFGFPLNDLYFSATATSGGEGESVSLRPEGNTALVFVTSPISTGYVDRSFCIIVY